MLLALVIVFVLQIKIFNINASAVVMKQAQATFAHATGYWVLNSNHYIDGYFYLFYPSTQKFYRNQGLNHAHYEIDPNHPLFPLEIEPLAKEKLMGMHGPKTPFMINFKNEPIYRSDDSDKLHGFWLLNPLQELVGHNYYIYVPVTGQYFLIINDESDVLQRRAIEVYKELVPFATEQFTSNPEHVQRRFIAKKVPQVPGFFLDVHQRGIWLLNPYDRQQYGYSIRTKTFFRMENFKEMADCLNAEDSRLLLLNIGRDRIPFIITDEIFEKLQRRPNPVNPINLLTRKCLQT